MLLCRERLEITDIYIYYNKVEAKVLNLMLEQSSLREHYFLLFSISVFFSEYDFRFVGYWIDFSEAMFSQVLLQWDLDCIYRFAGEFPTSSLIDEWLISNTTWVIWWFLLIAYFSSLQLSSTRIQKLLFVPFCFVALAFRE